MPALSMRNVRASILLTEDSEQAATENSTSNINERIGSDHAEVMRLGCD